MARRDRTVLDFTTCQFQPPPLDKLTIVTLGKDIAPRPSMLRAAHQKNAPKRRIVESCKQNIE